MRACMSVCVCVGTLFLILLGEFDFDEMAEVSWLWAILFFILYVIFMFFVVLNIFLAILNDAYTVVHTNDVWEELEKRKPRSLREKFEVQKAMWRERKNLKYVKKLKKEKVGAAQPTPPHPTTIRPHPCVLATPPTPPHRSRPPRRRRRSTRRR